MSEQNHLTVELHGHVAQLCFAKPPHNHLDADLMRQIMEQMEALDADPQCRVFLLSSVGKVFCAGADFNDGSGASAFDPTPFYFEAMRLFRLRKPVVAAIQGAAIGAGLGLAVAADFRIATQEARFSANFSRLGFHPGFGLSLTLPRLVGQQHAARLFYTGCRIDGAAALAMGLVDELVGAEELLPRAIALATEIAISAPIAVQSTRETLRRGLAEAVTKANQHECAMQLQHFQTADCAEGLAAARERRQPRFSGH